MTMCFRHVDKGCEKEGHMKDVWGLDSVQRDVYRDVTEMLVDS